MKWLVRGIVVSLVVVATSASASAQVNSPFTPSSCELFATAGSQACKDACSATTIDATFVANAEQCVIDDAGGHRPTLVGGAVGATSMPWVSIVTDFFVTRLKGEAALFLRDQVADQLCPDDAKSVTNRLFPTTCGVLRGAGSGIATLPTAFRKDVDALPDAAFGYALELAEKSLPSLPAKDILCVGAIAPKALAALRGSGPLAALNVLANVGSPHTECDATTKQVRDAASWVLAALEELNATNPGDLAKAVSTQLQTLLVGQADVLMKAAIATVTQTYSNVTVRQKELAKLPARIATAVDELGDRWRAVEPLLTELAVLLKEIRNGDRSPETTDRAAELTVRIVVAVIDVDDATRADMLAIAKAVSAIATRRYLEGALALFSVQKLDDYLGDESKVGKTVSLVWKRLGHWTAVLAGLADAKSPEDAQAILEAAAVPLGSYREFTQGGWKGFISGWAGIGGGGDLILEEDPGKAGAVGPILPVGVEVGRSIDGGPTSVQFLVSVIDIGALATARFDDHADAGDEGADDALREQPDASFASVFAPGLFVGIRPKNLPFVFGGGAELLPKAVVKFDCPEGMATCEDTTAVPTIRFMAFVAFDLTAFRIF